MKDICKGWLNEGIKGWKDERMKGWKDEGKKDDQIAVLGWMVYTWTSQCLLFEFVNIYKHLQIIIFGEQLKK